MMATVFVVAYSGVCWRFIDSVKDAGAKRWFRHGARRKASYLVRKVRPTINDRSPAIDTSICSEALSVRIYGIKADVFLSLKRWAAT